MAFDVCKVKLENHLSQATENESEGSDSTRVMALAQLILHCGAFQKLSSSPSSEQNVCFLTTEALFISERFVKSARQRGVSSRIKTQ
jgi:hypothetical protein